MKIIPYFYFVIPYKFIQILETVSHALREEKGAKLFHRAVDRVPRSGTAEELYEMFGLSADKIYNEVKEILSKHQ